MGQLSFYSADARPRALSDLEGVLCAAGEVSVFGRGAVARLSIVLGEPPAPEPEPEPLAHDQASDTDLDGDRRQQHRSDDQDGEGGHPDGEPSAPDPDDFAFLDLDPEELAALLERRPHAEQWDEPSSGLVPEPDPVAEWRAQALRCAFAARGVEAEIDRAADGRPVVRSAYRADLAELAREWTKGPEKAVPADLELDGPRLRLWVLAAGRVEGRVYVLGLDPAASHMHEPLLTASRRAGLGATLGGAPDRPVLRIVGRRRRRRLVELVGHRPRVVAEGIWPDEWPEQPSERP